MYFRTLSSALLLGGLCFADFKYEQTARVTGGYMLRMMQTVGRGATDPITITTYVKGEQMAMQSPDSVTIFDLAAETTTTVNLKNQTYSVMTFAETKEQMEKALANGGQSDVNLSAEGKETGKTATVNNMATSEWFMTMPIDGGSGGQKGQMRMEMSLWISSSKVAGYEEVTNFQKKMVEKIGVASLAGPSGPMAQPGMAKGMAELNRKMAEMGGVPLITVMRMIPTDPDQIKQIEAMQSQPSSEGRPNMGDALAGALGGRLGGFGRKKKTEEAPTAAPAPKEPAKSAVPVEGSFSSALSTIESMTELRNFSTQSVDPAVFAIPTSFKKEVKPKGL